MLRGITVETIRGSQIAVQDNQIIVRARRNPTENFDNPIKYNLDEINFTFIELSLTDDNEYIVRLYYNHVYESSVTPLGRYSDPLVAALLCANIMQSVKEVKLRKETR